MYRLADAADHPPHSLPSPMVAEAQVGQCLENVRRLEAEARELAQRLRLLVEDAEEAARIRRGWSWRHVIKRLVGIRLGYLWDYPPRPLRLPRWYGETAAPAPAPLISIVTPSFNQAPFLERTLHSILDQGYPRLEYVVQDGASADGTQAILERYQAWLTHWESAPDGGQTQAINLGFRHTSGEIMAYLNSDDLLLPGSLACVARYFAEHAEVDVVYGHRILIDENDGEVGRWVLPPHDDRVLAWANFVPQETLFWRRRIWERVGGALDASFRFAMDWDLILRFLEAGARFVRLPRFLGAFRVHSRQKTSAQLRTIGEEEMGRLRRRCHGRGVTPPEISRAIRPYLLQHALCQRLYQIGLLGY
jgi:GT2 family glycosyltransferase